MSSNLMNKIVRFASSLAPGIFIIGYIIGTGSVTTMAAAGAKYGMSLTWTLALSCLFTYIMIIALTKYTIVTGNTILYGFKESFGKSVTLFIIAALLTTNITSIIGVMAIITDVVREWSRPLTSDKSGISTIHSALFFTFLLYGLFFTGKHHLFLKAVALMVALMGISFVMTMFIVTPEPSELIKGMVPAVPKGGNAHLIIAGMVGTTMAAIVLVTRSYTVHEKKWGIADFHLGNRDAIISMVLLLILNMAIIASAAGTMFPRGIEVENAIDMVKTLEPLAGRFAVSAFVVGIISAGLSSLFPNYIVLSWLLCDYLNIPRDLTKIHFRILVLLITLAGFVVPVFGGKPVILMIASQAISPVVMPLMTMFLIILLNKKSVIGEYTNGRLMNVGLVLTFIFSLFMFYSAVVGLGELLR